MRLLNVLQAQSVKVVRLNGSYGYLPDAVKAVVERYQFIGYPKDQELAGLTTPVDPNVPVKPIVFTEGKIKLGRSLITITNMQILPQGLLIETRSNTDDSDRAIEDAIEWASGHFKVSYEELKPAFGHFSALEFKFERPLSDLVFTLSRIGRLISSKLEPFWGSAPAFELTGLTFFYDKSKSPAVSPPFFRIDRRAGQPFEHGVFWSDAPLSTDNHVEVLSELEKVCLKAGR